MRADRAHQERLGDAGAPRRLAHAAGGDVGRLDAHRGGRDHAVDIAEERAGEVAAGAGDPVRRVQQPLAGPRGEAGDVGGGRPGQILVADRVEGDVVGRQLGSSGAALAYSMNHSSRV